MAGTADGKGSPMSSARSWDELDPGNEMSVAQRVAAAESELRSSERQVAMWVALHPMETASMSAGRLAAAVGVSDASVVRTARALGYEGFTDLKEALRRDLAAALDMVPRLDVRTTSLRVNADDYLAGVSAAAHHLIDELYRRLDPDQIRRIAERIHAAGTTHVYGIGPSGVVADYLALRLGRIGVRAHPSHATGFAFADDLVRLRTGDCLVLIAPGRFHRDMDVLLDTAKELGLPVLAITDTLGPLLAHRVEEMIWAPFAPSGVPGEAFTTIQVADILTDAVASLATQEAESTYKRLTLKRDALTHRG